MRIIHDVIAIFTKNLEILNYADQNKSSITNQKTRLVELWANMCHNNEEAFVTLYNIFFEDLCRYGKRITNDKALIEDSIQDLFVEVWKSRNDLPEVNSVKYYLYKRLKRKIIKKLIDTRKIPLENNVLEEYNFNIVFSHESELISKQFSEDQQRKLLKALNNLSRRQKEAITLRFYDGFNNQEVAGLLSMNTKSVRNLIYRAMLVLKKVMLKSLVLLSVFNIG